jgi:hypothetical protein
VSRFRGKILAAFLLYASAIFGATDRDTKDIPVLTVCQVLRDPARYGGRAVIVVGRSVDTSEGSWLDENCGTDLIIEGRKYPFAISTSYSASEVAPPPPKPRGFRWDKRLIERTLAEVKSTARLESHARWFAVYGRLETATIRTVARGTDRLATRFGYGHLGAAPAQMVARNDCWFRLK